MNKRDVIGLHIHDVRKEHQLTQEELAELVSLNKGLQNGGNAQTISRVENATINYGIDTLIAIAEALDVPLKDLIPDSV